MDSHFSTAINQDHEESVWFVLINAIVIHFVDCLFLHIQNSISDEARCIMILLEYVPILRDVLADYYDRSPDEVQLAGFANELRMNNPIVVNPIIDHFSRMHDELEHCGIHSIYFKEIFARLVTKIYRMLRCEYEPFDNREVEHVHDDGRG